MNGATRLTTLAPSRPGLPYGVYPRLILIHVATSAVRSRLRHLVLGETVTAFLRRMEIGKAGGKRGQASRARDQIERLRQTTFTYRDFNGRDTANIPIFDKAEEETANRLKIVLGETFYKLATEHPVPLDEAHRAAAAAFAARPRPLRLADLSGDDAQARDAGALGRAHGADGSRLQAPAPVPLETQAEPGCRD